MVKPELHLIIAGAGSLIAALGISMGLGLPSADAMPHVPETAMASYVEAPMEATQNIAGSTHEILPASDGLYYLDAKLTNGRSMRFLVDTGASVTVLTAQDARLMGVSADPSVSAAKLRTAGGTTVAKSATIGSMTIAGRELRNIEAAIIDNGLPVSLLGQNALSELGTITLGNGRLTIG